MTAQTAIAIKQFLIICLGLFGAASIFLSLVPSLQRRNARRTRLKAMAGMPMSLKELGEDRDRLRAQFAHQQRRVEQKLETQSTKLTEEMAELGRRAARIAQLEQEAARLMSENAALRAQEKMLLSEEASPSAPALKNDDTAALTSHMEEEAAALRRLLNITETNLAFMTRECDQLRDQLLRANRLVITPEAQPTSQLEDLASLRRAIAEFGEQIATRKRVKGE